MKGGYTRQLVEKLLPAIWDEEYAFGMREETAPDPDMPKGSVDKSHSNTLYAHLADIRYAWPRTSLALTERQAVLLRYGLDLTTREAGELLGCDHTTVTRREERAVGKLTASLNGERYVEGYDGVTDADAA